MNRMYFDTVVGLLLYSLLFVVRINGEGGILKCPGECEFRPCACCEELMLERCGAANTCHANGCNQCDNGLNLFKRGYSYYCEYCDEIFGSACRGCQDFNGCQQCYDDYERVLDPISELYYCKPKDTNEDYTVEDCGPPINQTKYPDHGTDGTPDEYEICTYPTSYPTSPTPNPSPNPSPSPTPNPTPYPSQDPTDKPTSSPSPGPTPNPTPYPSDEPTDKPTTSPTPGPTPNPTPYPSDEPTDKPTTSPSPGPTPNPTPYPSDEPTDKPTTSPSPGPTPNPSPEPSPSPTPRPTGRPTGLPTVKPVDITPNPTPAPTPQPTEDPSPGPTPNPSPQPTPEPTPNPVDITPNPTPNPSPEPTPYPSDNPTSPPTYRVCEYDGDFSSNVVITVSNGCDGMSSSDCDYLREYITALIEQSYPSDSGDDIQFTILPHNSVGMTDPITGTRDEILAVLNDDSSFVCGYGGGTNYDNTTEAGLDQLVSSSDDFDQLKLVIISTCSYGDEDENDNTCLAPMNDDPDNLVEITVINLGSDVSDSQFKCLYDNYDNNNYIEEHDISNSNTAGNDAQEASEHLCEPRDKDGCPPNLVCPEPCMNDPCDCVYEEVGECAMSQCHPNGCNLCMNGYFKKDYNYPCVSCKGTFGDDCIHCSDFLGCQQCSTGIRTYDPGCELYYCDLGCDSDDSDSVDDTPSPSRSPTEEPDSYDSGSMEGTPSPSRSPTEEPVYYSDSSSSDHETTSSSEDIDTTSSSSDTHTTRSSSSDDTGTTTSTPQTTYPCIDGYFEITSVSDSDYGWAVGVYHLVYDGGTEFVAFVREDSSQTIRGVATELFGDENFEYAYIVNTATGDGFAYEHFFDKWSVFGGDEITPEGTFEWIIINSGTDGSLSEDTIDVTLLVYDCDDNLITVPDCTRDCIVVSNFESSYLESHMFDPSEFEGSYCYMDEYGYYFKDYNEIDGEAFYVLGIDDVEGSTLDNVVLYYENGPFEFDITFDAQWDSSIYGDFACDSISTFFNDNSEGKWYVDPDGSTFEEDSGTVDTSAEMDLTFVNCDGADFLCGDETANSANNLLYNNLNSKLQLFVVIGVSLAMLIFA